MYIEVDVNLKAFDTVFDIYVVRFFFLGNYSLNIHLYLKPISSHCLKHFFPIHETVNHSYIFMPFDAPDNYTVAQITTDRKCISNFGSL